MASVLYASVLEARNYIVGAANAPSGLYRSGRPGGWEHLGWQNVRAFGMAADPFDAATLVIAGGNGVLRSRDAGASWRVTTDWRVTEVLGVAFDPHARGTLFAATGYGVWRSTDGAESWLPVRADGPPDETFSSVIAADASRAGRWLLGTEAGLAVSEDGGSAWTAVGPPLPIRDLCQARTNPSLWMAATEDHGLLRSTDGGATWHAALPGGTFYAVAIDPAQPERMAAGGYNTGLHVSEDGGSTWTHRPLGLATEQIYSLAFDPDESGRLWGGMVNEGLFVTDDLGRTVRTAGLAESTVTALVFAEASH